MINIIVFKINHKAIKNKINIIQIRHPTEQELLDESELQSNVFSIIPNIKHITQINPNIHNKNIKYINPIIQYIKSLHI